MNSLLSKNNSYGMVEEEIVWR